MATLRRWQGPTIDVQDGATVDLVLDLSALLPGTLEGSAVKNGQPLANAEVSLSCRPAIEQNQTVGSTMNTDDRGRFTHTGEAGTYRATLRTGPTDRPLSLRSTATVDVVTGQTTHGTFEFWTGLATVTLLDDEGKPAAGVQLLGDTRAEDRVIGLPPTDAAGRTHFEWHAGRLELLVMPQRLQTWEAQRNLRNSTDPANGDPVAAARIALGSVTLSPEQPAEIELRLPPEWRQ
jgi:hypothetical protein